MQEVEADAGKNALAVRLESPEELLGALLHRRSRFPRSNEGFIELDEDPFASDLGGGEPLLVARWEREDSGFDRSPLEVVLALQVRADGVEPAEAHLHAHLAQLGDHDEAADAGGDIEPLLGHTVRREERTGVRNDPRLLRGSMNEAVVLRAAQGPLGDDPGGVVLRLDRREHGLGGVPLRWRYRRREGPA